MIVYFLLVGYLVLNIYILSKELDTLKNFNIIEISGIRLNAGGPNINTPLGICNEKGECVNMVDALTQPFVEIYYFEITATIFGGCVIVSEWRSKDKKPKSVDNKTDVYHVEDDDQNYYHDG